MAGLLFAGFGLFVLLVFAWSRLSAGPFQPPTLWLYVMSTLAFYGLMMRLTYRVHAMFAKGVFVPLWLQTLEPNEFATVAPRLPLDIVRAVSLLQLRRSQAWWPYFLKAAIGDEHANSVLQDEERSDVLRRLTIQSQAIPSTIWTIGAILCAVLAVEGLAIPGLSGFGEKVVGTVAALLLTWPIFGARDRKRQRKAQSMLSQASPEFLEAAVSIDDLRPDSTVALQASRKAGEMGDEEFRKLLKIADKPNA